MQERDYIHRDCEIETAQYWKDKLYTQRLILKPPSTGKTQTIHRDCELETDSCFLTLSLLWYHLKTTNISAKIESLMPFRFVLFKQFIIRMKMSKEFHQNAQY